VEDRPFTRSEGHIMASFEAIDDALVVCLAALTLLLSMRFS
jgi:hypothetical protein